MNFGVKKNSQALLQRLPFELKIHPKLGSIKDSATHLLCLVMW
jgi:hypothetical protein